MNNLKQLLWQEAYRPQTIDQFCLKPEVKQHLKSWEEQKQIPHLILYGDYGVGKTSIVKFLIKILDCEVLEINASKNRGIDLMREEVTDFITRNTLQPMKLVVFHEGEKLTKDAQDSLKEDIENASDDTRFIFTTNQMEKVSDAIKDRCLSVRVYPDSLEEVGKYVYNILQQEEVEVSKEQKKKLWELIQRQYPSIRKILKNLQSSVVNGTLTITQITEYDEFNEILNLIKSSNSTNYIQRWHDSRDILNRLTITDLDGIYSFLEKHAKDIFKEDQMLEAVTTIAEYDFRHNQVIDKQLNVAALLAKLFEIKGQ